MPHIVLPSFRFQPADAPAEARRRESPRETDEREIRQCVGPCDDRAGKERGRGHLRLPKRVRKFVHPVYMVYPESRDEEAYEPMLGGLRREAAKLR